MSAKGRGAHRGGDVDFYPTPAWPVHRLLDAHADDLGLFDGHDVRALEPTCGDGAIVRACDSWPRLRSADARPHWTGVELRPHALDLMTRLDCHVEGVDFRAWDYRDVTPLERHAHRDLPFDVIIGNPPFNIAESIIRRCLDLSPIVVMLLRVGFLGSGERLPFWRGIGEGVALRVLPDRPSFDGEGTDSSAYAWFVWGCDAIRGVEVLDETPVEIRNAQKPGALFVDPRQRDLFASLEAAG